MNDIANDTIELNMDPPATEGNLPTVKAPAIVPQLEVAGEIVGEGTVQDNEFSEDPAGN